MEDVRAGPAGRGAEEALLRERAEGGAGDREGRLGAIAEADAGEREACPPPPRRPLQLVRVKVILKGNALRIDEDLQADASGIPTSLAGADQLARRSERRGAPGFVARFVGRAAPKAWRRG